MRAFSHWVRRGPPATQLAQVRKSDDPRFRSLREGVEAADRVVAAGRARGWATAKDGFWDNKRKDAVLGLCRSEFPETAVAWLDATAALGQDGETAVSRLLGTGGNFGRQDLSATYLARLLSVLHNQRSADWLRAALTGAEDVPYLRNVVGQFDPGRAGGIQSSPWEKADDSGFVNPWAFLLTLEGTLLFATAIVRRHGADYQGGAAGQRNAVPFQVRGSTAGYAAAAAGENPLAELWTPEWAQPAGIVELEHLFGEGRVEWGGHPARTGLDFARAVTTLGVDRGLTAFERHLFVDRLGQNPLAVPAGRVEVGDRPIVGALDGLDGWLDRLRWDRAPATVDDRRRELESALFALARSGGDQRFVEVIVSLGRCHDAVARSGTARERANPLLLGRGQAVLEALKPAVATDVDLRIALAVATAQDHGKGIAGEPLRGTLREFLTPVNAGRWTDRPAGAAVGLVARLAEAARRRAFPGANAEIGTDVVPSVGGPRLAFTAGLRLDSGDAAALVHRRFDEGRCTALVSGLQCFDWPPMHEILHATIAAAAIPDPAVDMLLPFTCTEPLTLPGEDGVRRQVLMRPDSTWPVLLGAGRIGQVLQDAARRLRISGVRCVVEPGEVDPTMGIALAALLVVPVAPRLRLPALSRVAALPTEPPRPNAQTSSEELA